jgi:hypothetical protein
MPAIPTRHPAALDDDLETVYPLDFLSEQLSGALVMHDPEALACRTPLWTLPPLDNSTFALGINLQGGDGADAYPSPPGTPTPLRRWYSEKR